MESTKKHLQISEVIREIHRALIDAESREALDAAVCEAFATSTPYLFAWIGTHDPETDRVVPRASAGLDAAYLDSISISLASDPEKRGPTATAVRTGQIQVMQDIRTDPAYKPWRQQALDRGFESSAAIPIADGTSSFGVLNLYADRPDAFGERELALLSELGETIASAHEGLEAQRELQTQKEKYERITARISDGYYAVDSEWRITFWNEQMATRSDKSATEVQGETLWETFPSALGTEIETQYREAMATKEPRTFEYHVDDRADYWVEVDVYPDEDGLSIFSREITGRKEREQEIRETTQTLEAIIEAAPDPIVMIDDELRVTIWNPAAERVFGWSKDEILGERAPFVPDEKEPEFERFIGNLDRGRSNRFIDTVRRAKDGERIDVSLSSAKIEIDDAVSGYLAIYKDIRQRKEYERQIEALHDETRRLIAADDKQDAAEYIVDAAENLLDFPISSVWYPREGADGLRLVASSDAHRQLLEDADTESPTHPRGGWFWELFEAGETVVRDPIPREDLAADVPLTSAIFVPLGDHGLLTCATRGEVEFEDDSVTLGTILGQNTTSVLDALEYESKLQVQRDNIEVLDQMVRHDIRNDLQVVLGFAEGLEPRVDDDNQEYVRKVLESAETAIELTQTARDIAEVMLQNETQREAMPLRRTLHKQVEEARATNKAASITVETKIPKVHVLANELLSSVFRNLLKNAIQHNDKGVPEVSVSATERESYVSVQIADNGPGVPHDQHESIFGKGETGLDSDGTGIGLYLVHTLVESYGGTVRVADNDPEGAIFTVRLPVAD